MQLGQDDERVGLARRQHPVQHAEGGGGPTGVDRFAQVPRGERARLPQEGLEIGHRDRGPLAVGRGQGVEEPGQPAHVGPEVLAQPGLAGPSRRTGPPRRWSLSHWVRALPVPTEVSTTSPEAPTALDSDVGTVPPPATSTSAVVSSGSAR